MKSHTYLAITASALALTAQGAQAQEFYAGIGYELGGFEESDEFSPGTFDGDFSGASFIAGLRAQSGNSFFYGAEFDVSAIGNYNSTYWPTASADMLVRGRAIVGTQTGNVDIFAALGYAWLTNPGPSIGGPYTDAGGITYGLGVEVPVTNKFDLRVEVMRDELGYDDGITNYNWDNTSVRAAAVFSF